MLTTGWPVAMSLIASALSTVSESAAAEGRRDEGGKEAAIAARRTGWIAAWFRLFPEV